MRQRLHPPPPPAVAAAADPRALRQRIAAERNQGSLSKIAPTAGNVCAWSAV